MQYEVILLQPAVDFLRDVEVKLRARAFRTIELLGEFGPFLKQPHSKKIKGAKGLFELRVQQGNNICRLFYFHRENRIFIITSGYIKKTMKTDRNEIEKAMKIMERYNDE